MRAASIEIDMGIDDPEVQAARRQQRELEAEQRRQENALPSWWEATQDPNAPKRAANGSQIKSDHAGEASEQSDASNAVQDDCECLGKYCRHIKAVIEFVLMLSCPRSPQITPGMLRWQSKMDLLTKTRWMGWSLKKWMA